MRYVVSGTDLVEYATMGSGPGLVLVHGTGGDAQSNYGHLTDRFSDRHTVITPNYSGSGGTKDSGGPLTAQGLARQVEAAVIDAGVTGPVAVVGFSLGAAVAAALAAIRPELVSRLVLVAGWAVTGPRQRLAFGLWRRLWSADPALFARFVTAEGWSPAWLDSAGDGVVEQTVARTSFQDGVGRQMDLDAELDISALVPGITAPTLVIGATRDQVVPVTYTQELHKAIPGSRYAELDSGHMVIYERPDELTELIRDFIA